MLVRMGLQTQTKSCVSFGSHGMQTHGTYTKCAQSCLTLYMDYSPPGSSVEFFRQESWSRLSFPPPGDLSDSGIESTSPMSPALADKFFTAESPVHPCNKMSNQFLVEAAFFPHSTAPAVILETKDVLL